MVPYLLLCLLVIGEVAGQIPIQKECYSCQFKFQSYCFLTTSYTAQCQENSNCGVTTYTLGGTVMFYTYGCFAVANCNQTATGTTALRAMYANTTCCINNFCNGGFTAQAPHLAVLGLLSVFLLYTTS